MIKNLYLLCFLMTLLLPAEGADSGKRESFGYPLNLMKTSSVAEYTFYPPTESNALFLEISPDGILTVKAIHVPGRDDRGEAGGDFIKLLEPMLETPTYRYGVPFYFAFDSFKFIRESLVCTQGIDITVSGLLDSRGSILSWGKDHKCIFRANPDSPSMLRSLELLPLDKHAQDNFGAIFGGIDFSVPGIGFLNGFDSSIKGVKKNSILIMGCGVRLTIDASKVKVKEE